MEVQLYVYDLSKGMARAMSQQFLGIQIDAVYHTSLVFDSVEYLFGMGVQTCYPGSTHHGRPMEIVPMGTTELPMDVIMDYLESLKEVYTPESYDLFAHNCNNFTNDFAMFLVGKVIPDHITNLPRRVLETPFGQMLKPQIDEGMRSITQAPVAQNAAPSRGSNGTNGMPPQRPAGAVSDSHQNGQPAGKSTTYGRVINVSNRSELEKHLRSASNTASTIFFTSSTCAPCKVAYPMFDQLAEQHPQALFVKVDISSAPDVASHYQIRATPTFMAYSRGSQQDTWTGADPNLLKSNVERLMQHTFPPHPHTLLRVSTLQFGSLKPVTYSKVPPLDKLMAKLGSAANNKGLSALRTFVQNRNTNPKEAPLPDFPMIGASFVSEVFALPMEVRFAAIDLLRCAMADSRVAGFFAEHENSSVISSLIEHVNGLDECPHNLRLVTIHLACNLFTSPLLTKELSSASKAFASLLIQLITSSLLDASHPTTRVAAASLAFNLASVNYRMRREETLELLGQSEQVELAASLLQTLSTEDSSDATKALLLSFGYLVYCAPVDGELMDLCKALDANNIITASKGQEALTKEIATLL